MAAAMPDLVQLRTFVTVAEEGHLTRAAERLHISQPTASTHIRALEAEFRLQLFHRTARGLEPTAAGLRLAEAAGQVLGRSRALTGLAEELRGSHDGRLSIGTLAEPGLLALLPCVVQRLQRANPLLTVNVEARNSLSIKQGIRAGELHAGFFLAPQIDPDLDGFRMRAIDYVVAGPHGWRETLERADLRELAALPWVGTPPGSSSAELIQHMFRSQGVRLEIPVEVSNEVLLRAMIAGGLGVGFMRRDVAEEGVARGIYCIVPGTCRQAMLQFGYRRARAGEPLLRAFIAVLQEGLAEDGGTPALQGGA